MKMSERLLKRASLDVPAVASLNALISAAGKVRTRWPDFIEDPPEKDRDRLVRNVRERFEMDNWAGAQMSLVTSAARALFDPERRGRPELAQLREFYLREVHASTSQAFLGAMLAVYIDSFAPEAEHTRALAAALNQVRSRLGARAQNLLRNFPQCLNPLTAPEELARLMMNMPDCWRDLKSMGISAPHASGLMEYTHLAYVRLLRPKLRTRSGMEELIRWLKPQHQKALTSRAGDAIIALLDQWVQEDPPQGELTYLTQSLITLYGDPRVSRGGVWAGVPDRVLSVLFRWLTGENIRFFLDVVSAVEESHMWAPRREFWLSLHEQRRIDTAWVAFSGSAVAYAKRDFSARSNGTLLKFGRQSAGGARADTSLLILRIGNKVVVEGSHSYRVHIFREDNPHSPKLYQPTYDCEHIRLAGGAEARAHVGNWQGWVLERI
jgi:hypothetical protein